MTIYKLGVIVNAVDRLTSPVGKMINSMQNLEKVSEKASHMEKMGKRTGVMAVGLGIAFKVTKDGLVDVVRAGDNYNKGLNTLSTVTTSTMGSIEKSMQMAGNATREWIKKHNTSMDQFLDTSYAMGSAGLNDVAALAGTRTALALAKGTMADAAGSAELLAMTYNKVGNKSADVTVEMMRLGDQFAKTQQMFQLRNLGQLQEGLKYAIPTMLQYQNSLEEVNVVLGQLNNAGMQGSMAGTSFAASQAKMIQASRMLGFELAKNEQGGLSYIGTLDNIRKKFGTFDQMSNGVKLALRSAFGEEGLRAVSLLLSQTDQMKGQVDQVANSAGTVTSLQQKMEQNLGDQFGVLNNNMTALKVTLSKGIIPVVEKAVAKTIKFVSGVESFARGHPKLTKTGVLLAAIGTGLLGITAAMMAVISGYFLLSSTSLKAFVSMAKGFNKIKAWVKDSAMLKRALDMTGKSVTRLGKKAWVTATQGIKKLAVSSANFAKKVALQAVAGIKSMTIGIVQMGRKAWVTASTALPSLIAATWSFTTALLANPITWVIVGLIALGGAIYFAAKHWDQLKDFAVNAISTLIQWISNVRSVFKKAGVGLWDAFTAGIKAVINKPVELVKAGLAKVRELLPFSDAKRGPLSTLTRSGGALITTIGSGVVKQRGHLPKVVGKELQSVSDQIKGSALPKVALEMGKPQVPILPKLPDLNTRVQVDTPKILAGPEVAPVNSVVKYHAQVSKRPKVNPIENVPIDGHLKLADKVKLPNLPRLKGKALYDVIAPKMPRMHPVSQQITWKRPGGKPPDPPNFPGFPPDFPPGSNIPSLSPDKGNGHFRDDKPPKIKSRFIQEVFTKSSSRASDDDRKIVIKGPITIKTEKMNDENDLYKALIRVAEGED